MVDSDDDGASGNSDVMVDSDDDGAIGYGDFMAGTPVDIKIYAHSYEFVLDMPGLETADVRVQVKPNNVLIISGERRREEVEGVKYAKMERRLGKMMRKFALPGDANMDKITSGCRAGVLTVVVERLPPAHPMRPTMIEVKREAVHHCGDDRKVVGADDRISLLPNELLLCVLSLLSFKEAVATSILSHRWKYLHTFIAKLDFDGTELLQKANNNRQGFDEVKRKFLRLVDGIVRLNQCSPLEKFRVLFLLKQSDTQHIDRWVRFALSRKVESLELILTERYSWCNYYDDDEDDDEDEEDLYTLNKTIFTWEGVTSSNASVYTLNLAPSDVYNLNLKKLSTYGVNVSGEAVEMLLQSCPLMEQVSIVRSEHLLWLKIIKPFPSFKSLEIILCKKLTCVVVRDSNIETLKYTGHRISFVLQNVPLLTELWTDWMGYDGGDVVRMFSSVLPQLHTFKMRFDLYMPCENDVIAFCSTLHLDVEMSNLKQLVVNIGFGDGDSLLPYLRLIRASPRLERFVIEIPSSRLDKFVEGEVGEISAGRKIPRSYPHLKEVKFVGYCGVSNHFNVLKHFVKNAVALETIVVDPCGLVYPYLDGTWEYLRREFDAVAFERAKALKDSAPFGINVKIL